MHGSETKLTQLMEGADKRFIVPVYQRIFSHDALHYTAQPVKRLPQIHCSLTDEYPFPTRLLWAHHGITSAFPERCEGLRGRIRLSG